MSASKANDGIKTQLNFKTSQGSLINVYLYSYDEAEIKQALEAIANVTAEVQAVETLYNAQGLLREALGATPIEQSATKSTPASAPASGSRTCKHGVMTYRESKDPENPWRGYFCPSPKGTPDQCKNQYIRS